MSRKQYQRVGFKAMVNNREKGYGSAKGGGRRACRTGRRKEVYFHHRGHPSGECAGRSAKGV